MFKGKESRPNEATPGAINSIVTGTLIEGNMVLEGNIRFEGRLKGNIESKGKVVIGSSGFIEGDIICQDADIAGQVKGNIFSKELTRLSAGSEVHGDIKTGKLAIEPGALFTGACMMNASSPSKNTPLSENKKTVPVSAP